VGCDSRQFGVVTPRDQPSVSSGKLGWARDGSEALGTMHTRNDAAGTWNNPQVPGTTPQVPGTTLQVPGTTPQVPGTASQVPGTTSHVPGTTSHVPGTTSQVPGTARQVPGTTRQVPGTTRQVPGTARQVSGTARQVPGVQQASSPYAPESRSYRFPRETDRVGIECLTRSAHQLTTNARL
jgi:hypothetical protein